MTIYSVIAEQKNSNMYLSGIFSSQEKAEKHIAKEFGTICNKIDTLPGSCLACICQYRVFNTIISICESELDC